jgi:ArsR family metal-binding transcriptional regulator
LTEDGTASVSTTNSKNVDESVKQTETAQRPIDETCDSKESPQTPLEESSVPESEVKHVIMFTNPFDLK